MKELNLNKSKILLNKDLPIKIGYDVRIYDQYHHFAASCLFHKAKIFCSKGEFGISDEDFSKELNIPLRTFKRAKQMVKDRLDMRIDKGNKTYYTLLKDLPYDPIYYRSFELNHCLIMNNNYKGGAFLGQCLYWWNKALEKGELEFSKTDKQVIEDLPFLSLKILKIIKRIAVIKGFITIKRKKRGTEWGVSHYTLHLNRIERAIKENCVPKGTLNELLEQVVIVCAKRDFECVPKGTLSVCQKGISTISNSINNSILSSAIDQISFDKPDCEAVSEERKKLKNDKDEQPISASNQQPMKGKEEKMEVPIKPYEEKKEIYTMIGIWKETVSNTETITLSSSLKFSLEEAFTKKFDSSLDKWKAYCVKIASKEWLMGNNPSGWKAMLVWAIKPESIDKVLSGFIYDKKKPGNYKTDQKPITLDKQELIDEVFSGNDPIEIKKIKITLIDSMGQFPKDVGLISYHTYLRRAIFELSQSNGKQNLTIKSSYNAYISLLSYHRLIASACHEFDEVIIYGGTNDRFGNQLYMQRISSEDIKPSPLWEKLCVERGIQSFVSVSQMDIQEQFPEKTVGLMG
jgi:hypothetical protein